MGRRYRGINKAKNTAYLDVLKVGDIESGNYIDIDKDGIMTLNGTAKINDESSTADVFQSIKVGGDTNYCEISSSGAISLNGNAGITVESTGGLVFSGTPAGKVISAGSYGSKLTHSASELITLAAEGTEDDFYLGIGSYIKVSGEDGKGFPLCTLVESTHTTGTDRMQGLQAMSFLGTVGGSEAAHLKTLGGDATAGMYAGWFKVGANSNCVCDSGSRVAAIWVDNQMSGTISGEEYGLFCTTGASKPDALIGLETTSSGWAQFLLLDETMASAEPFVASGCNVSGAGASEAYLKVSVNGTQYGLPLIAI
jgi:hypothetical protein